MEYYIQRVSEKGYRYDRYGYLTDRAESIFKHYGIEQNKGSMLGEGYQIVAMLDELHILVGGEDIAKGLDIKDRYVEGSYEELKGLCEKDGIYLDGQLNAIVEKMQASEVRTYTKDEWESYFCGSNDELQKIIKDWGDSEDTLVFESEEQINAFWHSWGRYFVCDFTYNS